jgi:AAA+ ATPase superfamily predicted ATPase
MARRRSAITRQSAIWERPIEPIANPYVVGDPVYPPLLAGRKDIFNAIHKVWSEKENPDSIILYGHRRMGKSSILRNLDQVAQPENLIVYADMDGDTSFVESTADFLLTLADRMHTVAKRAFPQAHLPEPDPAHYDNNRDATLQFNRLAESIHELLDGHALILALDEFEAIERAVAAGKIESDIYHFLRSKTQEPWLTIIFGGLHTLDEMSREYRKPFYGSYNNIHVSYLSAEDAWKLITNPTPDFSLNYEPAAVERIIAESGGQPMLVQLICRDALDNLNHEIIDLNQEREVKITLHDVETILNDGFFRRGTVYFDGVWNQTQNEKQRQLLHILAQKEDAWSLAEIVAETGLSKVELQPLLQWAERHDILEPQTNESHTTWQFHVPLMRRWIRQSGR